MDISGHIAHRASWAPRKVALRYEGRTLTFADLERAVGTWAAWMRSHGVSGGDRVAFLGPNCPELVEMLHACGRLGGIFVPLNARMPAAELSVFVERCRPSLLLAEESSEEVAASIAPAAASSLRSGAHDLGASEAIEPDPELNPAAPTLIAFTSGTTGHPKGAVFSHQNLSLGALRMIADEGLTAADEILVASPMFHVAALLSLALPSLWAGATITIHRQFEPGRVLEDLERYRVTRFMSTPGMTRALVGDPGWAAADLSSLRTVFVGSTFIHRPAVEPWHAKGVRVIQGYGMTEAPGIALTPPGASPDRVLAGGKPGLYQRVRLVDPAGHDVPAGDPGEIWVRGPTMMTGYWEDEESTRAAHRDGWFATGDVGIVDEEGYLRVVDRLTDMIIVGTSNVYPAELEAVLASCPQIDEAAVVGWPDADLGEAPVACVVPARGATLTAETVLGLFTGRLAIYKHPRQIIFLDSLPRNALGKVQKGALRELVRAELVP
jgi:fatty-acyl-CoA synthase